MSVSDRTCGPSFQESLIVTPPLPRIGTALIAPVMASNPVAKIMSSTSCSTLQPTASVGDGGKFAGAARRTGNHYSERLLFEHKY